MLKDGMLENYRHVLLAVSGGGDSLALLYMVAEENGECKIDVATVNHGLRQEAGQEAEMVKGVCEGMGLSHEILKGEINVKDAKNLREMRYELLVGYAERIGAEAVVTGHTKDDQVETMMMRAARIEAKSHTGGMAAMARTTAYRNVKIVRPLLDRNREELRDYLQGKNVKWVDDPSNEDLRYERARVRQAIASQAKVRNDDIARLAKVCGESRLWLNRQTVTILPKYVKAKGGELLFEPPKTLPRFIVGEVISLLVRLVAGNAHRVRPDKLKDSIEALQNGGKCTKTAGHTIIYVKNGVVRIVKENRIFYNKCSENEQKCPNLDGFVHFRPYYDDCLYHWAREMEQGIGNV